MPLIDRLYIPREQDLLTLQVESFTQKLTNSGAAVTIHSAFPIPADKCLVLQSIAWNTTPGAAQNLHLIAVSQGIYVDATSGVNDGTQLFGSSQPRMDAVSLFPAAAAYFITAEFDDVIIPGGKGISIRSTFSGAAAVNTAVISIVGYTVPRGNISL